MKLTKQEQELLNGIIKSYEIYGKPGTKEYNEDLKTITGIEKKLVK